MSSILPLLIDLYAVSANKSAFLPSSNPTATGFYSKIASTNELIEFM